MRTCGNVGVNTVFYSFGAATIDARGFRDTLSPQGTMFNDALDDDYWKKVISGPPAANTNDDRGDRFELKVPGRMAVFTSRYSQAMARASSGQAYVVEKTRDGEGGGIGAYQNPTTGQRADNRWYVVFCSSYDVLISPRQDHL